MSCPNCDKLEAEVARLSTDPLTGLVGRGIFEVALQTEFARSQRYGRHLGVIMIDVDHFKSINDTHGHLIGDQALACIATRVLHCARTSDTVARFGGEEFVILTDNATPADLYLISERVRHIIEEVPLFGEIEATVSLGFAIQNEHDNSGQDVLARADAALYRAKGHGRNRVEGE